MDVDGTLYDQTPVRIGVAWRLLKAYGTRPVEAVATLRALRAYRRAQDILRTHQAGPSSDLATAQVLLAAEISGESPAFVGACVARWMHQDPLDLVARARRDALVEFLHGAKRRGFRLGVFSDYPAAAKLEALGVAAFFDVVVTAQDPDVQAFKPSPRGLEVTLCRLGAKPDEALHVGDRLDVDAPAARRASMACAIIGRRQAVPPGASWVAVPGYRELADLLACSAQDPCHRGKS